jgi:phosphoglucosamine mutase
LRATGETLAEACADMTLYPQKLINVKMPAGFRLGGRCRHQGGGAGRRAALDGSGRVLLRPSGTEPLLRVMVEGRDAALVVLGQAEAIAGSVRQAFGA